MRALIALAALAASLPAASEAAQEIRDPGTGAASGGALWIGTPPREPPRRVVTLAPSLTDMVVALGQADRLVGVTRYDDAPEVAALPRVGGFLDPNPEVVIALDPDLVLWVTDGGALPAVRRLADVARASRGGPFPILAVPVVSVADVLATARLVGAALGHPARGERLAADLAAGVERVRSRTAGLPRPRVLFVVGREPLVVAGPGSFPDELLRLAGAENAVAGDRPWPVYPLELAVAADPDVVVDAAVNEPADGIARISAVLAVRRGAVVRLANDDALRPGPRLVRGLEALAAALHPEERR
jgi:iron complex transport system substrate-binding protein